jgi:anti-sigma factor RsiW
LDEETLNLHFDGELAASHASGAQRHLEACAECEKRLAALERLRELVVLSAETAAEGVDFDRMFGQVERDLSAQPQLSWLERMKTLLSELVEHRPMQVFVPATGVALAAAWLVFSGSPEGNPASAPVASDRSAPQAARGERDPGVERERMMLAEKLDSEVVQVDFGENSGTVFEIALAGGASTPVVWINDEE